MMREMFSGSRKGIESTRDYEKPTDMLRKAVSHWYCKKCGLSEGWVSCINCNEWRLFEYVCSCGCHNQKPRRLES